MAAAPQGAGQYDPFEDAAPATGRSIVVRRDPPAEYDPFDEEFADQPAPTFAEAPAAASISDPFAAVPEAPAAPRAVVAVAPPAGAAPVEEPRTALLPSTADLAPAADFDAPHTLGEPDATFAIRPIEPDMPEVDPESASAAPTIPATTALAPSALGDELEAGEDAVGAEVVRRTVDGDRPQSIVPNPFAPNRPEYGVDAEVAGGAGSPIDDEDDFDPRLQRAPGEYDIRPIDPPAELTPEQRAQRAQQLEQERERIDQNCQEILNAVRADDIKSVSLDIRMHGEPGEDFPFECGLGADRFQPRSWPQITYMWKAAGLCHKPLYFEQVQLERYGHALPPAVQPLVSGAHFFGTLPVLPYKMGLTTPNECIYTLGYYRPGSCAPYMIPAVPFTWRAAAFEAGAWTAGSFIFP